MNPQNQNEKTQPDIRANGDPNWPGEPASWDQKDKNKQHANPDKDHSDQKKGGNEYEEKRTSNR